MTSERMVIRSYQRIFRPERRIYQIEGHALPIPGGIPLRWVAYAAGTLLVVLALSSRSLALIALAGIAGAIAGLLAGGVTVALAAAAIAAAGCALAGVALVALAWPLRLLVLPALIATVALQATPDGRPAHRYALAWLALRLRAPRRSLGRPLPAAGACRTVAGTAWVAPDEHARALRRARVTGPARVRLEVAVALSARAQGAFLACAAVSGAQAAGRPVELWLGPGERLELRP